jgi:hypothetical protein
MASMVVDGDLNTHMHYSKKRGGSRVRDLMSEKLADLISDWDLQDIRPIKGKYT